MPEGNVFQRLQKVRDGLQECDLKRTGINKEYTYFEMEDFWPDASRLFTEQGLFTYVSFGYDLAILTVLNLDHPSQLIQTYARVSTFKGLGSPVQDQGGADTYVKRRMYLNLLELNEKDIVDGTSRKSRAKAKSSAMEKFNEEEVKADE